MIPFLSLLILIYLEYKNKNNIAIVIGLSLGMLIHIFIDIITLKSVGIFYPLFNIELNLNLNNFLNLQIPNKFEKMLSFAPKYINNKNNRKIYNCSFIHILNFFIILK